MTLFTLRQAGPIHSQQDPSAPNWYPPTTVVGDAATAWRDDSDATYAVAHTPTQAQISAGNRQTHPTAALERLPADTTDFTMITAHWRVSTESNYARRVAMQWGPDRATADPASLSGDLIERYTLDTTATPGTLSAEIWPTPYEPWMDDPYTINRKAQFLVWLKTGHMLAFFSLIGGGYPSDYTSTSKIYEAWLTVDAVTPAIAGDTDNVRRRFT